MQMQRDIPRPLPDLTAPALDAAGLIDVWEAAAAEHPLNRALMLLSAAWPGEDWARVPIGARDRALFRLRGFLFGSAIDALVACPVCATELELSLSTADFLTQEPEPMAERNFQHDTVTVRYRLPDTLDLLAVAAAPAERRRDLLLQRCIAGVREAGATDDIATLSAALAEATVAEMARVDPQADIRLDLTCPGCGHGWNAPFDIVGFLWSDIEATARRLLRQVHVLAGAYGWSEQVVLALTARRRRFYLEAVTGAP
jgi:hypothetical protein